MLRKPRDSFTARPGNRGSAAGLPKGTRIAPYGSMTAQPAHRRFASAALLLAALTIISCVQVKDASDEAAKKAAADSSGGAVYVGEAKPNAPTPSPDTYGADSATPVRGFGPAK